jgi:hypothetical protein
LILNRFSFFLILLIPFGRLVAQNSFPCDSVTATIKQFQSRIDRINYTDPELITLHYLFVIDLENEINSFYQNRIYKLDQCSGVEFYKIIDQTDACRNKIQFLKDTLFQLKDRVDQMFYDDANLEYQLQNYKKALYYIDRSLEFKPLQINALLLKNEILFSMQTYTSCIEVLDILYHEVTLDRDQEIRTLEFNMRFYEALYHQGDSLIKIDKATDAYEIFNTLETFCNKMPSGYCNDDYYHGILRSKVGVYESYLKIASVAKERQNGEMEQKFLQYAKEYLESNPELVNELNWKKNEIQVEKKDTIILTKPIVNNIQKEVPSKKEKKKEPVKKEPTKSINKKVPLKSKEIIITRKEESIDSTLIRYQEYQELVKQGIDLCIKENFEQAFEIFLQAEDMEKCNCFQIDGRVSIFLRELRKYKSENKL